LVKIGEVVDALSSGAKQVLEGKEYDYIFGMNIYVSSSDAKILSRC
jgi:hypothetical protein